ncbi:MAG: hypothetical protein FJW39_26045 [Acidobacteria bacterium]|nr:hypothetical protein [Acidobacteriota bacterium]
MNSTKYCPRRPVYTTAPANMAIRNLRPDPNVLSSTITPANRNTLNRWYRTGSRGISGGSNTQQASAPPDRITSGRRASPRRTTFRHRQSGTSIADAVTSASNGPAAPGSTW